MLDETTPRTPGRTRRVLVALGVVAALGVGAGVSIADVDPHGPPPSSTPSDDELPDYDPSSGAPPPTPAPWDQCWTEERNGHTFGHCTDVRDLEPGYEPGEPPAPAVPSAPAAP